MADRNVRVRLSADVNDYTGKMGQAAAATDKVAKSAEKAGKATQKSGQTASEGWSTLASGATKAGAAVAVVGGSMVKSYMDFDAQMSKVGAATNASAADMGKLRQAAMDAGKEFGQFTSTDAAGALEELGKAGLNTGQSIQALSGTMGLAASDGMAVGEAAELTADALNMFGLKGDQATRVADRLAQGAGAASGSAKQLGQGLSQVGAVANQMGVPMDDTVQSLALFAKNGIKGSDAGTSLKTMLMSLANPSKQAAETMKDLGIQAFDTHGNFVGMRDLAGQLNTKLSGLTTEQKNAALATMFGSDAMRVAGVMAKEGAGGYDAMGTSMKGFGSASEIAAKKTANLKGRFAELGGAWENFGIQMGAAADGPLTKAVGGLTSLLELASRHPAAAQEIGMAAAALVGLGVAGAGVVKTVQGVQAFTGALKAIGLVRGAGNVSAIAGAAGDLSTKGRGVSAVSKAISGLAPLGVAAGVAAIGVEVARIANADNTARIEATRTSIEGLSGALGAAQSGSTNYASAIDTAFQGTGAVFEDVTGALIDMQVKLDNPKATKINELTHSMVGMKAESAAVSEQMGKLDSTLAGLDAANAAVGMQQVSNANAQVGLSTEKLVNLFPQYAGSLRTQAQSMGVMSLSAQELEGWMGGKLPASVRTAAQAAVAAGGANAAAAQKILQNAAAAEKLSAAVNKMPSGKKLDVIVNAATAQTTIDGFVAKLKGLPPKTIAELKTIAQTQGLDAAKAKLKEIKDKQVKVSTKGDTSGATTVKKAVDGVKNKTAKVSSTGDPSGALKVTGAVKAVPNSKTAKVSSTGNTGGADRVKMAVKAVPVSKTATVNTIGNTGGANAARSAVNAVPASKTSTITTIFRTIKQTIMGKATGGYISGPGTGTSDDIPAMLSNGEYVLRAAAVARLGRARLDHLNATGALPAFASGGLVGAQRYATGGMVQTGNGITITYQPVIDRTTDMQRVGTAAAQLAAALERNRAAVQASTKASAPAVAASARLTQAQQAKSALSASHRVADAQWDARIAQARTKGGGSGAAAAQAQVAAIQARAAQADLAYRTKLAAAEAGHKKAVIERLQQERKAADLAFDKQIAAARKGATATRAASAAQKAAAAAEVKRLQAAKKANDLQQAQQMASATAKVTAAERAKTLAVAASSRASEQAKATSEAYKQAQQELAQAQQRVREQAKAVSDAMAGRYGLGWDGADSATIAREGAAEVNRLIDQIVQLRKMGLSESVVQRIADKGPGQGTEVAADIIAGGKASVDAQNAAARALQLAAERLGRTVAIGRATGGPVFGAGTATSDSIPAWLSNGEHVWTAREVNALGGHRAMLHLRAAVLRGSAPHFAIGGQVGGFSQSVPRYAPQQRMAQQSTQLTFAPQVQVSGVDPDRVSREVTSTLRHEYRSMAVQLPGA